jgi:hypothetical protein
MEFRGTIVELRQRLGLGEPQDLRPDGEAGRLINPLYIAVNSLNSHIITLTTINDDRLKLLQELWDATTCRVIWKHEQLHLAEWGAYPTFTNDGSYAGFYDEDRIHLVDVGSKENFATVKFPTEPTVSGLIIPKTRPIMAFAIWNGGRHIALVRRNTQKPYSLQKRVFGERSLDWINVTDEQKSPQLAYSSDANHIFVVYQGRKERFMQSSVPTLVVDCFNVHDLSKLLRFETREGIESFQFRGQMVEVDEMDCVLVDVTFREYHRHYCSKRVALAIAGNARVKKNLSLSSSRGRSAKVMEILVFRRKLVEVSVDGSAIQYPSTVLMSFPRDLYPNCTVLAIDARNGDGQRGGRVTFLSQEGQIRTSTE